MLLWIYGVVYTVRSSISIMCLSPYSPDWDSVHSNLFTDPHLASSPTVRHSIHYCNQDCADHHTIEVTDYSQLVKFSISKVTAIKWTKLIFIR